MADDWNKYFSRIRLGRWTDNGQPCWMPFHGFHFFIAGETGYGKSNTERVLLSELSYGIDQGAVEVIGFDAQLGVELQPVYDAGYLKEFYAGDRVPGKTYEETFAEAFEKHVEEGMERTQDMRRFGINEWKITTTDPGRVILIDEAGQLFRPNVAKATKDRIVSAIDTMTYQFRKCGYVVVACTQQPNLNNIPIRHGLTYGIAHHQGSMKGYQQVTKLDLDYPPLATGVQGLCYITTGGKRIARTQYMPTVLPKLRHGREVNETRIPALVSDASGGIGDPFADSGPREWLNPTWEGRGGRHWPGGAAEPGGDPHL